MHDANGSHSLLTDTQMRSFLDRGHEILAKFARKLTEKKDYRNIK